MEVTVNYGAEPLEIRDCRIVSMPDGREGAVWRGQAFTLDSGAIDVSGQGVSPALCGDASAPANQEPYALRETTGGIYVLLAGSVTRLEKAAHGLSKAGLAVARTGRYLGEAIPGFEADWFVRLDGEPQQISKQVAASLGAPIAPLAQEDLRERLLAHELERALERVAAAKRELAALRTQEAENFRLREALATNQDLAEAERSQREAAETRAREAQAQADDLLAERERRAAPDRAMRSVADELDDVLSILLPRIRLLRDSREVAVVEFSSRLGVYRALGEIDRASQGIPPAWKSVRGATQWIERHVSTGRDDLGRAYARLGRSDRRWDVLISRKADQSGDVDWLKRQ